MGTYLISSGHAQYWRETFLTVLQGSKFASLTPCGFSEHSTVHGTWCWHTRNGGAHMSFSRNPRPAWATGVLASKNTNKGMQSWWPGENTLRSQTATIILCEEGGGRGEIMNFVSDCLLGRYF